MQRSGDWKTLGSSVSFSTETWKPESHDKPTFRYIEIGAVKPGSDDYDTAEVEVKAAPSRARMRVRGGDILLSTTRPDRGAIVRVRPEDDQAICSTGFAVLRVENVAQRDAIFEILQTDSVTLQLRQRSSGGAYPAITGEELGRIILPGIDLDNSATALREVAEARAQRTKDLAEANARLEQIDAHMLAILGLAKAEAAPLQPIFAVREHSLVGARLDTEFHSPRFNKLRTMIETGSWELRPLADIFEEPCSGFAAGAADQADESDGIPHLRPMNITPRGELSLDGSKFIPDVGIEPAYIARDGDILFNNTNSRVWVGKSAVFESTARCAFSNHMTRLRLRDPGESAHFYSRVLNALRSLGYFAALSTNFNNQAGVNVDTLKGLRLPAPTPDEQRAITIQINGFRDEARRLRETAEARWRQARARFEAFLLGDAA